MPPTDLVCYDSRYGHPRLHILRSVVEVFAKLHDVDASLECNTKFYRHVIIQSYGIVGWSKKIHPGPYEPGIQPEIISLNNRKGWRFWTSFFQWDIPLLNWVLGADSIGVN